MGELELFFAACAAIAAVVLILRMERRAPPASGVSARIAAALDGESVQLAERYDGFINVRIAGVRAPVGDEEGADWARDTLAALAAGKDCRVFPVDEDPDGFLVARILVDGVDLAEALVAKGHASPSRTLFRGGFRHEDEK
ncbi:MAG: thermonuclease family protein [Pseudomonadota bacterium]